VKKRKFGETFSGFIHRCCVTEGGGGRKKPPFKVEKGANPRRCGTGTANTTHLKKRGREEEKKKMSTLVLTPDEIAAIRRALPALMLREKLLTSQLHRTQVLLGISGRQCAPASAGPRRPAREARLTRRLRRAATIARRQHARCMASASAAATSAGATADCTICLSPTPETTACGHPVHEACISVWANECLAKGTGSVTCPVCRRNLVLADV
jgi:hypothetical protein